MDSTHRITRRELLSKMGTGLAVITISTAWGEITPAEAKVKGRPFRILTATEAIYLDEFADILLPGSREAGISHYVDDQLGRENPLLLLKYMNYPSAYVDFYRLGLSALNRLSLSRYKGSFDKINEEQKMELVREISQKNPAEWNGPPAPLFYFVVRNDAVDVYYGTPQGFEKLGVPYMAHIMPKENW
jgi:hypothetical protein